MKRLKLIGAIGKAILLAVLAVFSIAVPVLAYTYYATIEVIETGGISYSYVPYGTLVNNYYLSQNGYMLTSGLDTQVLEGATQFQHMVASDRVMFVVPSLGALSQHNYKYTLGNTPSSNFPIIVGNNGYVTVNDAPALEPGNNFSVAINGYINTSAGSSKNLIFKNDAFRTYISSADNITSDIGYFSSDNASLSLYSSASDGYIWATNAVYNTAWVAASGTADDTSAFEDIGQQKAGNFFILRGFFYFDTSPIPDTAIITSATLRLYGQTDSSATDYLLTIQNGQPVFPNDPLIVTDYDKTKYAGNGGNFDTAGFSTIAYNDIALNAAGLTWINLTGTTKLSVRSSRDIAGTAPTGNEYVRVYCSEQAGTTQDPQLVVNYSYYVPPVIAVSADCTSGVRSVVTSDNTTHLTISVYDAGGVLTDRHSVAFAGSVTDNTTDWFIDQSNVMPYMNSCNITVGGALVARYQPNTMVLGQAYTTGTATFTNGSPSVTGAGASWASAMAGSLIWLNADDIWHVVSSVSDNTHLALTANYVGAGGTGVYTMAPRLVDLQGASQDGAITWGTNPAGLGYTVSSLVSSDQPAPTGGAIPESEDIVPQVEQPGWFTTPTGGDLTSEPFYSFVDAICTASDLGTGGAGFTPYQIYLIVAMVIVFGVTALMAWKIPHMLFAGIMCMALTAFFVAYHHIFPWWTLVITAFFLFASIVFERKPSI